MTKQMVCVVCPTGCRLTAASLPGGGVEVTGNRCPRGESHGREELLGSKRTVTAVVRAGSGRVPVKTDRPLPFELINPLLRDLYRRRAELPVRRGDVFMENVFGTGVNVVYTRTVER